MGNFIILYSFLYLLNVECAAGTFGAGCTEDCNCASGTCNRFTGECVGECVDGLSGVSCQGKSL